MNHALASRSGRFNLTCATCTATATQPSVRSLYCHCGGIYDIRYLDGVDATSSLPLGDSEQLDLGQGDTPLVHLNGLAHQLGIADLAVKLEFCSPTGSFKDRGSAVLISAALEEGIAEFVEDSSGNAGASMSAYAARAGMQAHIFAPASAAKGKLDQIRIFGAQLHLIEGPRQAATDAATEFAQRQDIPYLSHALSPFFAEGMKAIVEEVEQDAGYSPTDIVIPAGNGALLIGLFAGYAQGKSPRIHCIQSEGVQPLLRAIRGEDWKPDEAVPTAASGIAVSMPPRVAQAADAVIQSGGSGMAVSDVDMLSWQRRLASETGIFCEVTSAAAFAGLEKMLAIGTIGRDARVLIPITGSGLKEPL